MNVKCKGDIVMWLDILKQKKSEKNISYKQIAERTDLPERTVTRIFAGETPNPYADTLRRITKVLDSSLDEIFEDTKAVVGGVQLVDLQAEVERLSIELTLSNDENAALIERVSSLTKENEILRMKLEHKEEIIAVHNYYTKIKAGE